MLVGSRYPPVNTETYVRMIDMAFSVTIPGEKAGEFYSKERAFNIRLLVPSDLVPGVQETMKKRRCIREVLQFDDGYSEIAVW